jgi:hypothetical protein
MESVYQIFVASSLRLNQHRKVISQAIDEVNKTEQAHKNKTRFCEFIYENRPDILQKLEKNDAQAPADHALRNSLVFFLIIEDTVKELTQYEFELAIKRFRSLQTPQFIYIFHKDRTALENTNEGISYTQLIKDNELNNYIYNSKANAITHKKIYDIPFTGIDEEERNLKDLAFNELKKLLESSELPFPGAVLGKQLREKQFFGNDILRLKNSRNKYYRRRIDDDLEQAIQNNKVILLTGNSLAGKTRATMEALKRVNNGWVYVINKYNKCNDEELQNVVSEFKRLTAYIKRNKAIKLYIDFDDIGLFLRSNNTEDIVTSLEELTSTILASDGKAVLVATSTDRDISIPGIDKSMSEVKELHISDMTDYDFRMAIQFFKSCGIAINPSSFKYKMMGALFVNLNFLEIKFQSFLIGSDLNRYTSKDKKDLHCLVRKNLLKSIKAQSIWRNEYLGDMELTFGMTRYYVSRDYNIDTIDIKEPFVKAIDILCKDGKMGVLRVTDKKIVIQEYVYRHLIDYDGQVCNDSMSVLPIEREKECIREILHYCSSDLYKVDEPLTIQVSRLASHCSVEYRTDIVKWLYHLWHDTCAKSIVDDKDFKLVKLLTEDRIRCESKETIYKEQSKIIHHYSHIIESYIYLCCDFNNSLLAFNNSAEHMHTDHLLCAVMRKARDQNEKQIIRDHMEYNRFYNGTYVIRAEIEWADDFDQAIKIMERFTFDEQPSQIANRILKANDILYGIVQRIGALHTLLKLVKTEDDFETALDILRQGFTMIVKDHTVLEKIRDNILVVKPNNLTILDLLSKLNHDELKICLHNVYGGNVDTSLYFLQKLTSSISTTLDNGFTTETEIRLLISTIGSWLINDAAINGSSFDNLYDTLFSALQVPYPRKEKTNLILRNSFVYTNMMLCNDCNIIKAINLFENDLVKHAADIDNPIFINRFTLNTLLKKCQKEDKSYLGRVNQLFNQLGVQRDEFSYYNLLKGGKDNKIHLSDCIDIVREMSNLKINHNRFTITAIMACPDVNLSMAISFLNIPVGLLGDFQVIQFPELTICPELKSFLSDYDEAWSQLFVKPCKTNEEKVTMDKLLKYLESSKGDDFFENGKIYNSLVKNNDYLSTCETAIQFVLKKTEEKRFKPDSYTVCHIIEKVSKENGNKRKSAMKKLNEFLRMHPEVIDEVVVNQRIHLYKNHTEQIPQVFKDGNGQVTEEIMTPIMYVETMQRLHFPINRFIIRPLTSKIEGISEKIYDRLFKVLFTQQNEGYYPSNHQAYNSQDSEVIRERLAQYLDKYRYLKLTPISALSHNKNITRRFIKDEININSALSSLDWSNENSAVIEFCNIFTVYINRAPQKDDRLFSGVIGYYDHYFGVGSEHTPSSFTFGVLVKAISSIDDFRLLIRKFIDKKNTNPRLTLQPMMLARLSAVVHDIDTLSSETKAYLNAGGDVNGSTADIYLYRIAKFIINTDPYNANPLLNDVFRYIILGGDAKESLYRREREYLLMNMFEKPSNVSVNTLKTIVIFNKDITNPMTPDEIVNGIVSKYRHHIPDLINNLVLEEHEWGMEHVREIYLPRLFDNLAPFSRPALNDEALNFLARQIPKYNIEKYNVFMQRLYTIDCRNIEAVTPGLINCIHRLSEKVVNDRDLLSKVRKTESQIFTYSELNRLHCGHLLIEKASTDYIEWCRHSMQSDKVSNLLENISKFKYDRQSMKDRIKYFINNLDDAFSCCLMTIKKHSLNIDTIDKESLDLITQQEKIFILKVKNGEVKFRDMQIQPLLWLRAGWIPSEDLVLAMIKAYLSLTKDNTYISDFISKTISDLITSMTIADSKKYEKVSIRYSTLGNLNPNIKKGALLPFHKLADALYIPILQEFKEQLSAGKKRTEEQTRGCNLVELKFTDHIKNNPLQFQAIKNLPHIWEEAKWYPGRQMIQAIIKNITTIVLMGMPNSEQADLSLDRLIKVNTYAIKEKIEHLSLNYRFLEYEEKDNPRIKITANDLSRSLPDEYIIKLRAITKSGTTVSSLNAKQFRDIINLERKFIETINNGNTICPPLILPDLWYRTDYYPNCDLVINLISYYNRESKRFNSVISYLNNIKKSYKYSSQQKKNNTRLFYSSLGICPRSCEKYIDVETSKLKEILTT